MKGLVFDIETSDVFTATKRKAEELSISVVGVYSYQFNKYQTFTIDELDELWILMRDVDTLIGFNNNHFDTPLLNKYANFDLIKSFNHIDLLASVRESLGNRIKLDWIAEGTLGVKKSGHGLQAVEQWADGKYEEVKKYCLDDVKITKDIFEYAQNNGELKYSDLGSVHTIQIDTSNWGKETDNMLKSLPLF